MSINKSASTTRPNRDRGRPRGTCRSAEIPVPRSGPAGSRGRPVIPRQHTQPPTGARRRFSARPRVPLAADERHRAARGTGAAPAAARRPSPAEGLYSCTSRTCRGRPRRRTRGAAAARPRSKNTGSCKPWPPVGQVCSGGSASMEGSPREQRGLFARSEVAIRVVGSRANPASRMRKQRK